MTSKATVEEVSEFRVSNWVIFTNTITKITMDYDSV
jgi:hypothetical protein